jgi:sporulation protein YlmC with PRC-barrel domain
MTEIHVELLLGTKVRDVDGEDIGRIEELRVERDDKALLVDAYLIGTSALIERLSAWTLVRPIQRFLNTRKLYSLYRVPWQDMDLSDPKHPRVRIAKRDLRHAK